MKKIIALAGAMLVMITLQACSVSTAGISDVKICSDADSKGICSSDNSTFKTTTAEIFLSANLNNAPSGTKVTSSWRYIKGELGNDPQDIDSVTAEAKEGGSQPYTSSMTSPTAGWPKGDYEVTLTLSSDNSTPVVKKFSIQ
ncbi:MAG: hypothetical protein WC828_08885 [Thermoleophilia bacterium]